MTTSPPIVLASASPRRHELLAALGVAFTVLVTDVEDDLQAGAPELMAQLPSANVPPLHHPTLLAWRKAQAAAAHASGAVVLGADTVVVLDGMLLNKPGDAATAQVMLTRLAGRRHVVYTGVCVLAPDGAAHLALVATEVEFAAVSAQAIADYVATGEPLDKAGAYGVQGMGGRLVRAVHGSYTAVVGLPLATTYELLQRAGVQDMNDPSVTYQRWLQSQGKEPLPCPPTLP
ncbi:MAG: septum formation protein Maf [Candidatus Viridilinea halotolerans]|uniref:dTTP/UTP pyrophosphatase n=1 Tax=Candidatus Viridilinea halotolerans TaxID=2491704 RepID=A0A426TZ47_9CHLR|nr:MAG: septum formation protein Maf [Candidatus Viridilinea halotolerans]